MQHDAAVMRALSRNDDAIADLRKGLTLKPNDARRKQIETALTTKLGISKNARRLSLPISKK